MKKTPPVDGSRTARPTPGTPLPEATAATAPVGRGSADPAGARERRDAGRGAAPLDESRGRRA